MIRTIGWLGSLMLFIGSYHKQQKFEQERLKFDNLCSFCQILFGNCKIHLRFVILDEFAKLSSTKLIYWQIRQILVLPIFCQLSKQTEFTHMNIVINYIQLCVNELASLILWQLVLKSLTFTV